MAVKINELRQRRSALADKLAGLVDNKVEFDKTEQEVQGLDEQIARALKAQEIARGTARPFGDGGDGSVGTEVADYSMSSLLRLAADRTTRSNWGIQEYVAHCRGVMGFKPEPEKHFRSLGEQLIAVANHYSGGRSDPRLVRAPIGAGETDAAAGGFLVQTDFATAVWTRAYDMGDILARAFKLPISANANGIKLPAVDESSRVTGSRWGGVQSYWVGEGDSVTATKPKFRVVELDLKKLMSVMYVSDEMLQDQTALESIATTAFSEEIVFMTEDGIIEGDGVGKPLGILNAPCLVTVAKDGGQAPATVSLNNILNMWSRMWIRSRKNAVWFINQDVEPQLYQLSQIVGTGGMPMYFPPGGISAAPYAQLLARPVIPIEYAATLGAPGDVILADFSQYVLADKRGMQAATSMHVRFLTDEMTFRFVYRVDGKPLWHTALTPFKGSNTKSPFVVLAQR